MAHFRAEIRGSRGVASRLGTKKSGIRTKLQTWGWDVLVTAWQSSEGRDVATVELVNHSTGETRQVAFLDLSAGTGVNKLAKPTPTLGACSCRPGIERDNCPQCEATGQRIDFAAIRRAS